MNWFVPRASRQAKCSYHRACARPVSKLFSAARYRANVLMRKLFNSIIFLTAILDLCIVGLAQQDHFDKYQNLQNTLGVIVRSKHYGEHDFIKIYNADGSLWYKFTFYDDDKNGRFPYQNDSFRPFTFHPSYFLLALKCVRKIKDRYEVIVNEETGLKKYVNASDPSLSFETWGQHILKVFSVDITRSKSPLLKGKQGAKIKLPKDAFLHPVKVEGDWLMVKWVIRESTRTEKEKYEYGWVKWRDQQRLLIELAYIA
ncbi:MAG: hypothetical protein JST84_10610 [Acidobacteria bacterium]|nr:hypothetical protein [Acidobacteriota bacterium]